jgi:hypothetical protein
MQYYMVGQASVQYVTRKSWQGSYTKLAGGPAPADLRTPTCCSLIRGRHAGTPEANEIGHVMYYDISYVADGMRDSRTRLRPARQA